MPLYNWIGDVPGLIIWIGTPCSFGCTITLATRTPLPDTFMLRFKILFIQSMGESNKHKGLAMPSGNFKTTPAYRHLLRYLSTNLNPELFPTPFHEPRKSHEMTCCFDHIAHSD